MKKGNMIQGFSQILTVVPLPIDHLALLITSLAAHILLQQKELLYFTISSKKEDVGKYFAFKVLAINEEGSLMILQAYLAKRAKLNA